MTTGITIQNVSKNYGRTEALKNVSIEFSAGKIYGLLGRNGAGKSTLLNIISNRIFKDSGEVLADGEPTEENDQALRKIYMMSEKTYYPEGMKIKKVIEHTKAFYPDFDPEYAEFIAKEFGLNLNKKVKELSTGYNSILKLMIALSVNTPYVFLDEPVLGLDANHREMLYKMIIEKYSDSPCTIVISTHLIEEVSGLIEEVIIIDRGRVLLTESRDSLLATGYSVSGRASRIDEFTAGKNLLGEDVLGGLKTAHIMGERPASIPDDLEITSLDLQKLFVKLTGLKEEK